MTQRHFEYDVVGANYDVIYFPSTGRKFGMPEKGLKIFVNNFKNDSRRIIKAMMINIKAMTISTK